MKIKYDPEVDILRMNWSNDPIQESDENELGIIVDYNEKGEVIGIEVLRASEKVENWKKIQAFAQEQF
jgi:uncharacterized protein YuzE